MTIERRQQQIVDEFAGLHDWFDKYEHLIELGKALAPPAADLPTDENALPGCQSQVWIRSTVDGGRMQFEADSDSLIIKGVLSLMLRALHDQPPEDVADAELHFLQDIGLTSNLSPSRANGVATIVRHMQQCGAALAAADARHA